MLRRSERKRENRPDKKVYFTEGNAAVKDYRASFQPNIKKDNVVIQYQNDPEHSDAIDQIKRMSMRAKAQSSKKLPHILKPLKDDEEEENPIDKFKREHSEENIPKKTYSTKTYTRKRPKHPEDDSDKQYFISPYFDKEANVETIIKTDYDPEKLMFPKKEKKSVSPKFEKENVEKTYIKTDYDREKLFPKKEKNYVNPKIETVEKTVIKTDYDPDKLKFPKKEKKYVNPSYEKENIETTYIKTDYDREKLFPKEDQNKEERSSSASKRRWYRKKEQNPPPIKETPPPKTQEIVSTTIIEPAKLPQDEGEIKKTASFIRNKYLKKDPNKNILKDKNLHISLPEDMPAVIEKVYENQDPVFDWNEEHEEDLKKKYKTYNPNRQEKKPEPIPPKRDIKINRVINNKENNERKYNDNNNNDNYTPPKKEEQLKQEPVRRIIKEEVKKPVYEVKVEKGKIVEPEPEKEKNVYKNVKVFEKKIPTKDKMIEVRIEKEVEVKPTFEYDVENEDEYEEVDDDGVPIKYKKGKKHSDKKKKKRVSDEKQSKELKEILKELKLAKHNESEKKDKSKLEKQQKEIPKRETQKQEEPKKEIYRREIHKREIINPEFPGEEKIIITEINVSEPEIKVSKPENLRDTNNISENKPKKERKLVRPGLQNKEIKYSKHTTYNTVTRTRQIPDTKNNTVDTTNTSSTRRKYYTVKNENIKKTEPEPISENIASIRKKYEKYENYKDEDDEPKIPSNPIRVVNKTITETVYDPEDGNGSKKTNYNKRIVVETTEEENKPRLSNDYFSNSRKLRENKYNINIESDNSSKRNKGMNRSFQKRNIKKKIPEQYCRYNTDTNLIEDLGSIEEINVNNYLRNDLAEIYNTIDEEFYDLKNDVFYANICNFEDKFGEFDRKKIPPSIKKFEIKTVKEKKSTNDMIRKYAHRARLIREENEKYHKY